MLEKSIYTATITRKLEMSYERTTLITHHL